MTNAPTLPQTRNAMIAALTELGKARNLASGDVTLIIREYVVKRMEPSYQTALAKLDELRPPKPVTRQPDTKRDLRYEARGIPIATQNRATPLETGKTVHCNPTPPRIGHGLSERQQLTFDRQCLYARYGRLTTNQLARLRTIEQRLGRLQ